VHSSTIQSRAILSRRWSVCACVQRVYWERGGREGTLHSRNAAKSIRAFCAKLALRQSHLRAHMPGSPLELGEFGTSLALSLLFVNDSDLHAAVAQISVWLPPRAWPSCVWLHTVFGSTLFDELTKQGDGTHTLKRPSLAVSMLRELCAGCEV